MSLVFLGADCLAEFCCDACDPERRYPVRVSVPIGDPFSALSSLEDLLPKGWEERDGEFNSYHVCWRCGAEDRAFGARLGPENRPESA